MHEFEVNGITYRCKKLTAFQQFHIARRLTPLLLALAGAGEKVNNFAAALAGMSDSDGEYVISVCLSAVERFNTEHKNWAAVWNASANRAMFVDLNDLAALLPIVVKVIEDNLGNFWSALPTDLSTPAVPTAQ